MTWQEYLVINPELKFRKRDDCPSNSIFVPFSFPPGSGFPILMGPDSKPVTDIPQDVGMCEFLLDGRPTQKAYNMTYQEFLDKYKDRIVLTSIIPQLNPTHQCKPGSETLYSADILADWNNVDKTSIPESDSMICEKSSISTQASLFGNIGLFLLVGVGAVILWQIFKPKKK